MKKRGYILPNPVLPYPLVDVCLRIPDNPYHIAAFLGAVNELGKWWVWEKTGNTDAKIAAELWRDLLLNNLRIGGACMCCSETNVVLFGMTVNTNVLVSQLIFNRYDGVNANSININAPNDFYSGNGSAERLNALCMAVKAYVLTTVSLYRANCVLAMGLAGALFLAITSFPVIGQLALALGGAALAVLSAAALAACDNALARDKVICCMNDALIGDAITQASFQQSLDNCAFDVGSHEAILLDAVKAGLAMQENWAVFIDALGRAYVAAQAGVVDCPCDECSVELQATGVTLETTGECNYQFTLPPQPATAEITRVGGGCFIVTAWGWSDPGWTATRRDCGQPNFVQVNDWRFVSADGLQAITGRDYPITVTFTVSEP